MKVWQAVGCGAICIVAFIGMIAGAVFYATSGITDTADEFFAAAADGDYAAAHELTSVRLRETTSVADLEEFVVSRRLGNVVETSWSGRSIENNTGELSGSVETDSGAVIPITVLLVSEADEWRIDGFDVADPGLNGAAPRRANPSGPDQSANAAQPEASAMIDPEALAAAKGSGVPSHMWLDEAWLENDYFMFSTVWKDRPSPASLAARYSPGALSSEEIGQLEEANAKIESAKFNAQGRLVVGYARTIPGRTVRTVFTYQNMPGATRPWQITDLTVDFGS